MCVCVCVYMRRNVLGRVGFFYFGAKARSTARLRKMTREWAGGTLGIPSRVAQERRASPNALPKADPTSFLAFSLSSCMVCVR